jgi:hypothetical protein
MNFVDEKSLLEAAEAAFQESWKTINLRDGWTSAKVKVFFFLGGGGQHRSDAN